MCLIFSLKLQEGFELCAVEDSKDNLLDWLGIRCCDLYPLL